MVGRRVVGQHGVHRVVLGHQRQPRQDVGHGHHVRRQHGRHQPVVEHVVLLHHHVAPAQLFDRLELAVVAADDGYGDVRERDAEVHQRGAVAVVEQPGGHVDLVGAQVVDDVRDVRRPQVVFERQPLHQPAEDGHVEAVGVAALVEVFEGRELAVEPHFVDPCGVGQLHVRLGGRLPARHDDECE